MILRLMGAALLLVSLGGCAMGPDYVRPAVDRAAPPRWVGQTGLTGAPTDTTNLDHRRWWEDFGDPALDALVEKALRHNSDLAAAAGRVLEAEAQLGAAGSSRWPSVEVGGTASRTKNSTATGMLFGPTIRNSFSLTATARWELDLWGRLARGQEAAVANLLAGESDRRALQQGIIARVVSTWLEVHELQMQVELNTSTVANFSDNLETVENRYRRGLVTALDVHLAGQNLAAARAQGPLLRQNLAAARRRLEILVGDYPAGELAATSTGTMPAPLPAVPAGLPSELLDRRPDLQAAEMRLHAATASIGQAKAALFPTISLTASGGTSSNELSNLFTEGSDLWSLVGNLFMPLINRGATEAQIKAAEARTMQAAATYRGAVLTAFGEVENALDQDRFQAQQEGHLEESVDRARRAVQLAEDRYRRGLDNILVALESQRRLYTAESQLLTTQRLRRAARVNLILALGGPWDSVNIAANEGADDR